MSNSLTSCRPLRKGQQLTVATMELSSGDPNVRMGSAPPAKRTGAFGTLALLSPNWTKVIREVRASFYGVGG